MESILARPQKSHYLHGSQRGRFRTSRRSRLVAWSRSAASALMTLQVAEADA